MYIHSLCTRCSSDFYCYSSGFFFLHKNKTRSAQNSPDSKWHAMRGTRRMNHSNAMSTGRKLQARHEMRLQAEEEAAKWDGFVMTNKTAHHQHDQKREEFMANFLVSRESLSFTVTLSPNCSSKGVFWKNTEHVCIITFLARLLMFFPGKNNISHAIIKVREMSTNNEMMQDRSQETRREEIP